jgi:transposase
LRTHIQHTTSQDTLPEIGKKIADKATRNGVAERFLDPAVQKSSEGDLARIDHDDRLLRALALTILRPAKQHDANTLYLVRTVPGRGARLRLGRRYAIHDLHRCPRVPDCVSYWRLGKCAQEAAGKRAGTAGTKIGNAYLQWAFAEIAGRFVRANPAGQKYLTRWEKNHAQGKALTGLAHT